MYDNPDNSLASDRRVLSYAKPARSSPALIWLCSSQLPSAIGIIWFWSIVFGFMEPGIWGVVIGASIMATCIGCLISGISALLFLGSSVWKTARALAVFQAVYLILFITGIAITIATHPSRGHPGGGF